MKSERHTNLVRAFRDGIAFQSSFAPALFEAGTSRTTAPTNPAAFEANRKRLTTFNMGGRMAGKTLAQLLRPMVEGKLALAKAGPEYPNKEAADAAVDAIMDKSMGGAP